MILRCDTSVLSLLLICVFVVFPYASPVSAQSWTNWETPPVHPIDITPDGNTLLATNLADARLEVYDISSGLPSHLNSIPVGIDPVSVRARSDNEAWVVNGISDSVSIVDLSTGNVVRTLATGDEPGDVCFAGSPQRAFVSVSQENEIWVFDLANLDAPPQIVSVFGEEPRALACSDDGLHVYAAIFDSGNGTTVLGGGIQQSGTIAFPPNIVNSASGPHGGVNPPPNVGAAFVPAINPSIPAPPRVGLIVRKIGSQWFDDNGGDWTNLVSGPNALASGRVVGWDLPDHDVAVINTQSLAVTYIDQLMTNDMALTVHPVTGEVTVVGTEATNEIRFEPNLNGTFVRIHLAMADPISGTRTIVDLNPHLDYTTHSIPQAERDLAIGDPRAVVWNAAGTRAWIAGKGSSNLVEIDGSGARAGGGTPIEVGEGPSGLALDEGRSRLYVHQHFDGSIAAVDTVTNALLATVPFYDPTPAVIKTGRPHLYDTHLTSGLGQVSCASCHIDARMDRLSWDLGDPSGNLRSFTGNCNNNLGGILGGNNCPSYHPMKGPMTTQTLQDIIGKEPHHWRGDRDGLEQFAGAFEGLLGDDAPLDPTSMQEFEDFLATIYFPPNPFRGLDNSLPTDLPLDGHFTTGRFAPAGQPLPNGNAVAGLNRYRTGGMDGGLECVTCHSLPLGMGSDTALVGFNLQFVPVGPLGERHHAIVSVDGSTNVSMKTPHLRNLYKKVGFEATQQSNTSGFGLLHDGSVDSIARFVSEPAFSVTSDQDVANMVAFMLAFSGSDLPSGSLSDIFEHPGTPSQDSHAAVGVQVTFDGSNNSDAALLQQLDLLQTEALSNRIDIIAKGVQGGLQRGWVWTAIDSFQSDRLSETIDFDSLRLSAAPGSEITFTVVPAGHGIRAGVDRDDDGAFDRDELDDCSDPADPTDLPIPGGCSQPEFIRGDCNSSGGVLDISDALMILQILFGGLATPPCPAACDVTAEGALDLADAINLLGYLFTGGSSPSAPFPSCGVDPSPGGLACTSTSACP